MSQHPTRRSFLLRTATTAGAIWTLARSRALPAAPATFRPRFSICNETFKNWPFDKAFAFAAACGYTGVEIAPFTISKIVTDIPAKRRREVRRLAEKNHLEVVGLHWLLAKTKGLHLTSPDREVRRRTARYLGDLARFCADLGGKVMIFGSPKQRNLAKGVSRARGSEYAAEVIHQALPVLEASRVRLAMEPLSPRITNFLRTADEAEEFVRAVDSPRCRLILDCSAMSTESSPIPKLIRKHRRNLVHFHANDPNSRGPGFGKLDFKPILQALRDIEYRGWISVEVFDPEPGPERLARESIDYMKRCVPEA